MLVNTSGLVMEFREDTHTYLVGDEIYKSVTALVKEHMEPFDASRRAKSAAVRTNATAESVAKDWDGRREYGIQIHSLIEKYLLGGAAESDAIEFRYFLTFINEFREKLPEYSMLLPEQRLFDPVRKIAGTADLVAMNRERKAILIDWKTCRKVYTSSYTGTKCKEPFQEMDDCNLSAYKIQLDYYRNMLEKWYDVSVALTMIVVLNSVNGGYVTYNVEGT